MADKDCTCDYNVFEVNPIDLASGPGVEEIVNACSEDWHEYKSDFKESVSVHPLEILLSYAHLAVILWLLEHTTVRQSKQLK